jgi:gliding motility-associated-like protein
MRPTGTRYYSYNVSQDVLVNAVKNRILFLLCLAVLSMAAPAYSQLQTCPSNISFSAGDLSFWSITTGLVGRATQHYPAPNTGVTTVQEYTIGITGIEVITSSSSDPFGAFPTIPTINGYAYNYSIKLGSTATSHDLNTTERSPGGFTRAITYQIAVPAGPSTVPYTMTYAYAMVLENGTHNSNQQPLFKATLSTVNGIIACASPEYYLPTFNDAGGGGGGSTGATLDSATAIANGFTNSPVPFLSYSNNNPGGAMLYDVWTKGWTEVTFDLSPYRGQTVTLTFESDNCNPGAHFAYAYVALRNICAGLEISGKTTACTNSPAEYSVPGLAGATYNWTVPPGWTIISGANTNIITVTAGSTGGYIINHQVNGCADLKDTIQVSTTPPTVAGRVQSDTTVCAGINNIPLTASGQVGNVLKWLASTDGISWRNINHTSGSYTAQNLSATTRYSVVVQNGPACTIDTSIAAVIAVDAKTRGGALAPNNINVCAGQILNPTLTLGNYTGSVINWQWSNDGVSWNNFTPANHNVEYTTGNINATTYYRTVVKNGVCAADTSDESAIRFFNALMPAALIDPDSAIICYGKSAVLNATITSGTSYVWGNAATLTAGGNGTVQSLPAIISATATPPATTHILLSVFNAGCPNAYTDTFHIEVMKPIIVFAGNDTSVVAGQPLQLHATVNDPNAGIFSWTPGTGLNFTRIPNPVATYSMNTAESVTYIVQAQTEAGCTGMDTVNVKVFKTGPDIFVPTAFSPNGDGLNDVIRPVLVGIGQLNFFRVYNRWGQLVYSTSDAGKGWDGRLGGAQQQSGNFVYVAQAVDYTGKIVAKKGFFVLIR